MNDCFAVLSFVVFAVFLVASYTFTLAKRYDRLVEALQAIVIADPVDKYSKPSLLIWLIATNALDSVGELSS